MPAERAGATGPVTSAGVPADGLAGEPDLGTDARPVVRKRDRGRVSRTADWVKQVTSPTPEDSPTAGTNAPGRAGGAGGGVAVPKPATAAAPEPTSASPATSAPRPTRAEADADPIARAAALLGGRDTPAAEAAGPSLAPPSAAMSSAAPGSSAEAEFIDLPSEGSGLAAASPGLAPIAVASAEPTEQVSPVEATPLAPVAGDAGGHGDHRLTYLERRRATRFRARKVRRLIRHIDAWSMLKLSLLFFTCMWLIVMIAGVMLWSVAASTGTVDNAESFIAELFALPRFEFDATLVFRQAALLGIVLVLAATGAMVLGAVIFNLISDLIGGVWVTVIEEESARPVRSADR